MLAAAAASAKTRPVVGDDGMFWNVVFFAILFLVVAALLLRWHLHRNATHMHHRVTLMVTIPKFKSEDEAKKEHNINTIRDAVGIAETFFAAVGGVKHHGTIASWFVGRHDITALEIVAHDKLVTFYVTVPKTMHEFLEEQLHAQYGDARIDEVDDYNIFHPTGVVLGGYLALKREGFFPIKTYKEIDSDPLNALTNALSKVQEGDGVAVQILVRPAKHNWREVGARVVKHMNQGFTLEEAKKGKASPGWFASKEDVMKYREEVKSRKLSQAEQKMLEAIGNKINKAGLEANIRVVASAKSADSATLYINNVMNAFGQYNIYEYGNSFAKVVPPSKSRLLHGFIYRKFSWRNTILLNTEELASLWHLPLPTTDTPNIRWMLARTAPAPTNMPQEGLLLGFNVYRGHRTEIYMKDGDRRRHMYIMGKTGAGKSEFIKNLAAQDIRNGKGVCVIDPHGDLADGLLELVPKERYDDVVYFNPSDVERPMGLNMLEAPSESMRDFAVQEMISIFMMLFPPEMIGPMFEHSMRNFMLTLMADVHNPGTIAEIPRMISDPKFQKEWSAKVTDPLVRSFWDDEMANTSDYHKSETMGYLTSKVGRFVENEMMRNIIGQAKSAFNFRQIMDEGKILLVNLSKGKTGEVNASLLGLIMVSKLQMAAFGRADMEESQRKDFYLYVDEFQNFITPSIATILSEARKYKLNLIMAHQYMGQLVKDGKSEIRDAVLGNVGSMFVSRAGPDDTEVLGKIYEPTFSPYDLMNNEAFTWNSKMIVDSSATKPFTLKAYPPAKGKPKVATALKEISRLMYGRRKDIVEREISIRAGIGAKPPVKPKVEVPSSL